MMVSGRLGGGVSRVGEGVSGHVAAGGVRLWRERTRSAYWLHLVQ